MKLKFRVLLLLGAAVTTLIILTHTAWMFGDPALSIQAQPALAPGFPGKPWVQADSFHGHLSILRKDLDLSNDTEGGSRASHPPDRSEPERTKPARWNHTPEDEALEYIREKLFKDKTFINNKQNLDKLILVGDLIKNSSAFQRPAVQKLVLTKEFMPDDIRGDTPGRTELKPGEGSEGQESLASLGHPSKETRAQQPQSVAGVELKEAELQVLQSVRSSRRYHHTHRRKASYMKLFNEQQRNLTSWQQFHKHISQFELYNSKDEVLKKLIHDLQTQPIDDCISKGGGTQLKLTFYFKDGGRSMFKPMRFPREQETLPDHFYFVDYERHNAEIASFYLDSVLEFHRVPPTVGRVVNITHDIKRFAESDLLRTFFVSPAGNICFHGQCDYYCDTGHAVCGHPELLEGSFAAYLPSTRHVRRKTWRHPWRRSYHKRRKADWEMDNTYCQNVRTQAPYNTGRRMLDLMDMATFDFLTGNMDRHHYETFLDFGNYTFPLHLDNGRAFGKSQHDELSILAPIYQCCLFRFSTLQKLLRFYQGPEHLSDAFRSLLEQDVVSPVLTEPHLLAMDRRTIIILKTVAKCIQKNGFYGKVVVDDGF